MEWDAICQKHSCDPKQHYIIQGLRSCTKTGYLWIETADWNAHCKLRRNRYKTRNGYFWPHIGLGTQQRYHRRPGTTFSSLQITFSQCAANAKYLGPCWWWYFGIHFDVRTRKYTSKTCNSNTVYEQHCLHCSVIQLFGYLHSRSVQNKLIHSFIHVYMSIGNTTDRETFCSCLDRCTTHCARRELTNADDSNASVPGYEPVTTPIDLVASGVHGKVAAWVGWRWSS